jgi:hypothetical protein
MSTVCVCSRSRNISHPYLEILTRLTICTSRLRNVNCLYTKNYNFIDLYMNLNELYVFIAGDLEMPVVCTWIHLKW